MAHRPANTPVSTAQWLLTTCALSLATLAPAQSTHLPAGHRPPDQALARAIRTALPAGATEQSKPLPVRLGDGLGKVQIVVYRRGAGDGLFHALAMVPTASGYRALPLPEGSEAPGNFEQIVTSVLAANVPAADQTRRALVILYYDHPFGQTGSKAYGRVYLYDGKSFTVDQAQSARLNDVRTAALARIRLEGEPQ